MEKPSNLPKRHSGGKDEITSILLEHAAFRPALERLTRVANGMEELEWELARRKRDQQRDGSPRE